MEGINVFSELVVRWRRKAASASEVRKTGLSDGQLSGHGKFFNFILKNFV